MHAEELKRAAKARRYHEFDAPIWGRTRIRSLTAREDVELRRHWTSPDGRIDDERVQHAVYWYVIACVVDAEGVPVFGEQDFDALADGTFDAALLEVLDREITGFCHPKSAVDPAKNCDETVTDASA